MAKHTGGCQCGAVRYEVEVSLDNPIACNCSRCQKLGALLVFAPRTAFHLISGEDALRKYVFNSGQINHLFCGTCGIQSFSLGTAPDGTEIAAINVNCLDGVEPRQMAFTLHDGRSV